MDASPDTPVLTSGSLLGGRYRLNRRIASGGMATVWAATDEVLTRPVAVKVLHPHLAADAQFVARFRREAIAAARLAHPSIVAIFDTCSQGGAEAIVMELVRGPTLRDELRRRGRFAPADAARVVADLADALAAAHAAGIVHRDVKPANVLLAADGRIRVADFGIAKAADGLDLTGTGTTLGTAKYLAPEQVDSSLGPVDGRADVYAAGVILHELLCGAPPFTADGEAATAIARLHRDPPRPSTLVEGIDPAFDEITAAALARDPAERFASAADLRDALRAVLAGRPLPAAGAGDDDEGGPPTAPVAVVGGDATVVASGDRTAALGGDRTDVAAGLGADRTEVAARDRTSVAPARPSPPAPAHRAARRRRWPAVLVSALVLTALAVAGVLWAGTGDDPAVPGTTTTPAGGQVSIVGLTTLDPPSRNGDGEENDHRLDAAIDGDPSTTWRTDCYDSRPFGGLKDGVGLVLELSAATPVEALSVQSPTTGWKAQVHVADERAEDLEAWGPPVAELEASGTTTTAALDGASGRFVLLWFTDLAATPAAGCGGGRYAVAVAELAVM